MFLLDKPYVSDFLKKTLRDESIPVVHTQTASGFRLYDGTDLVAEESAAGELERILHSDLREYITFSL